MSEMMKRRKKLTEPESRYYLGQLINALQYLHVNLVIHRDLKLGNLFLDSDMRIKVGDFGLATRLTTADEKRRTICGTPNYIAPEILEGKEGHSFEVDIWSAGVILFTLLTGKPPFEAKDVKSTYKRILANQYAFPDHTIVSEHAKSLIRHMLQPRPDRRPSLDYVLDHSFFTSSSAIVPTSLPESALREAPTSFNTLSVPKDIGFITKQNFKVNDENDPSAINRNSINQVERKTFSGIENIKVNKIGSTENFERRNVTRGSSATTVLNDGASGLNSQEDTARTVPLFGSSTASIVSTTTSTATTKSMPLKQNINEKGYSQKFEVYCDLKTNQGTQQQQMQVKKEVAEKPKLHAKDPAQLRPPVRSTIPERRSSPRDVAVESNSDKMLFRYSSKTSTLSTDAVDLIQNDLEGVQLVDEYASNQPFQSSKEAWTLDNCDSRKQTVLSTRTPYKNEDIQSAVESEPMQLCTPPDNICKEKAMGTLETMHEMLETCGGFDDAVIARATKVTSTESSSLRKQLDMHSLIAKVWVVRYVDYTSKYGLGFLLNTGSAGVYFNDSTKIVLSADGTVFQYIERKRKESSSSSEHVVQTHLMENYPMELQKKVTLLRHFRDYLVDQQKSSSTNQSDLGEGMPMVMQAGAITGASSAVKFGVSSATYHGDNENGSVEENEMPFLKKWVRTRHAILFRLSNRTVQVVFFDRSEVLLSSEARIVTYVSKQGLRSEHSLEEVLQTGRTDIAKRLKYTKDIMYRLINIQSK